MFYRYIFIAFLTLSSSFLSADNDADFLARRIMTLWQQGQSRYALIQAKEFINDHPEHELRETFCILLGELFLKEQSYGKAILYLDKVQSKEGLEKSFPLLFKSLYHAKQFNTLYQKTLSLKLRSKDPIISLYHAHSLVSSSDAQKIYGEEESLAAALKIEVCRHK